MELVFCLWLVLVSSQISVGTHRHGKCLDILVKVSSYFFKFILKAKI